MAHTLKRILPAILLLWLLPLCSLTARAEGSSALTLSYDGDGSTFRIYQVAEVHYGNWQWLGSFERYAIDLTTADWSDAAGTLASYVKADGLEADATGVISSGTLTFPGLESGLYLVMGDSTYADGYRYTPSPYLVYVEGELTSVVKYEITEEGTAPISLTVTKVWRGDSESDRPETITVQLLQDGSVYDTVTLTAAESWSCTWTDLDATAQWTIVEVEVPEGYAVTVTQTDEGFTLTNTWQEAPPHDEEEPTLPQTGQLWWPVVALGGGGLLLIVLGIHLSRRRKP